MTEQQEAMSIDHDEHTARELATKNREALDAYEQSLTALKQLDAWEGFDR